MLHRASFVCLFVLFSTLSLLVACDQGPPPSPVGQTVLNKVLVDSWPEDKQEAISAVEATKFSQNIKLGMEDDAEITVEASIRELDGGSYLDWIDVVVASNTDYTFTSGEVDVGTVFNKGTPEAPIAAVPVLVNFSRKNGKQFGTKKIEIAADGTVTAQ